MHHPSLVQTISSSGTRAPCRLRTAAILLPLSLLAACVRTQVLNEEISVAPEAPFRRVLVCGFTGDPDKTARFEQMVSDRLNNLHVETDMCNAVFPSTSTIVESDVTGRLPGKYDAILVVRREPKPAPNPKEKRGLTSVLLAPRAAYRPTIAEKREDSPRPSNIEQFVKVLVSHRRKDQAALATYDESSEETIVEPYGKSRFVYGAADLISMKQNRLIWSLGGYAEGGRYRSAVSFMKALSARIVSSLKADDLLP